MKNIILVIGIFSFCFAPGLTHGQNYSRAIFVDGICGMCKDRIEKAVLELEGIKTAEWDVETRMLSYAIVDLDFDENQVHLAVTRVGHDTKKYLAPNNVYDQLHACCKYRDAKVIANHQPQREGKQMFVDGICGMCKDRIEKAVLELDGIKTADWDVDSRMLSYGTEDEDFDEDQIHLAVTRVGHDTKKYLAPQKAYDQLHACCKYRDEEVIASHRPPPGKQLFVDGVCEMCKDRIESAVLELAGISSAEWDIGTRMLTFTTDDDTFDENQIHIAVTRVGHDTKKYLASQEAYDNLHACCKYRDAEVIANHQSALPQPESISGRILIEENNEVLPLPGVNIYWMDVEVGTITDSEGKFTLDRPVGSQKLIASYVGYYSDTLSISNEVTVDITLIPGNTLETVEVSYRRKTVEVSFVNPILVQQINSKELLKAACCTLAESFETNPTVDVSFTDAVTGTRQIEMLGLAGPYVQITRENLPDIRGLASIYGLVYMPGPWVEGIQLAKGPGSVVNGYESMTGAINVELKKPQEGEKFYFNLYGNQGSRMEANANARLEVNDKWSAGLLIHGSWQDNKNDRNEDGFLDMPIGTEWTAVNRWKYTNLNGWNGQFGIKTTHFDKTSGQLNFEDGGQSAGWGVLMKTNRLEGWAKLGKVFLDRPGASIGLQLSAVKHDQEASFGDRRYDAIQNSFYANLIYREVLGSPSHMLNSGLSFQWDEYDENLGESNFDRNESVPGAFVEYTYQPNDNFTAVAGLRGDHHNNFGFFLTPRLHVRYALNEKSVFRASAGKGRRTASIIAENIGMLASSRSVVVESESGDTPYGLEQEEAWNYGLNIRQTFIVKDRELILTVDGYHTRFEHQVVVDYDQSPGDVRFYNLEGKSYSNNLQAQLDYALFHHFDLRIAYRLSKVFTDYQQGRLERPLVSSHRAFINMAYGTDNGWAFDLTFNWQGGKRLPSTASNPLPYQALQRSPDFLVTNTQISKKWKNNLDLYLGVENLFNYTQENPIIASDDPYGPYFDSSLVWGPIFGRMAYAGLRYTIE